MNIDEELFNHLVTLYEDDIEEKDIKQKLKRMNASDLIDLKNSLDQENFEKVDKFMGIKIEESLIKEIDFISTLSGHSSSEQLLEYRDLKTNEVQAVRAVTKKFELSRKYKNILERIIAHDVNLKQTQVISLLKRLGFTETQTAGGVKFTGPSGNVANIHFPHGTRGSDSRFDRGIFQDIINTLKSEKIYNPEKYEKASPENIKKAIANKKWPKIEVATSDNEFEQYMLSNMENLESETKGQEITWFPIGHTQEDKLIYAIWPKGATINFEEARKKARELGVDMKKRNEQLSESKEIKEIAELAGIPAIGINETATAGGTSAGAVASGPVGPNKPHSSSKKKKKKKKKPNNPYSTGTDDLIRRWQ